MFRSMLVMCLALSVSSAFAHGGHEVPAGTLLTLEGQDAVSKQACHLYITAVGDGDAEQWYAQALTSYSHDDAAPAPVTVRLASGRSDVLMGVGENGQDQIAIFLDPSSNELQGAKSFNLKWLHGDHFHTSRCVNLQPVQH